MVPMTLTFAKLISSILIINMNIECRLIKFEYYKVNGVTTAKK
jgi:hypothetical protein